MLARALALVFALLVLLSSAPASQDGESLAESRIAGRVETSRGRHLRMTTVWLVESGVVDDGVPVFDRTAAKWSRPLATHTDDEGRFVFEGLDHGKAYDVHARVAGATFGIERNVLPRTDVELLLLARMRVKVELALVTPHGEAVEEALVVSHGPRGVEFATWTPASRVVAVDEEVDSIRVFAGDVDSMSEAPASRWASAELRSPALPRDLWTVRRHEVALVEREGIAVRVDDPLVRRGFERQVFVDVFPLAATDDLLVRARKRTGGVPASNATLVFEGLADVRHAVVVKHGVNEIVAAVEAVPRVGLTRIDVRVEDSGVDDLVLIDDDVSWEPLPLRPARIFFERSGDDGPIVGDVTIRSASGEVFVPAASIEPYESLLSVYAWYAERGLVRFDIPPRRFLEFSKAEKNTLPEWLVDVSAQGEFELTLSNAVVEPHRIGGQVLRLRTRDRAALPASHAPGLLDLPWPDAASLYRFSDMDMGYHELQLDIADEAAPGGFHVVPGVQWFASGGKYASSELEVPRATQLHVRADSALAGVSLSLVPWRIGGLAVGLRTAVVDEHGVADFGVVYEGRWFVGRSNGTGGFVARESQLIEVLADGATCEVAFDDRLVGDHVRRPRVSGREPVDSPRRPERIGRTYPPLPPAMVRVFAPTWPATAIVELAGKAQALGSAARATFEGLASGVHRGEIVDPATGERLAFVATVPGAEVIVLDRTNDALYVDITSARGPLARLGFRDRDLVIGADWELFASVSKSAGPGSPDRANDPLAAFERARHSAVDLWVIGDDDEVAVLTIGPLADIDATWFELFGGQLTPVLR